MVADALSRNPPNPISLPLSITDNDFEKSFSLCPTAIRSPAPSTLPRFININNLADNNGSLIPIVMHLVNDESRSLSIDSSHPDSEINSNDNEQSTNIESDPINDDEQLLRIKETCDSLLMQKDNHIIFIKLNGTPFDKGAKDYLKANKFPKYDHVTFERARVTNVDNKVLIALPIKLNKRIPIEHNGIINCVRSLTDVVQKLQLTSVNIVQIDLFEN